MKQKLTPQILLQNGWVAGLQTDNVNIFTKKSQYYKDLMSVAFRSYSKKIEILFNPKSFYKHVNLFIDNNLSVENFNNLMNICNLQEFKLHVDKPQKSQGGWIVDLSKFNIKSEYFKTAKMLKTWFLGFVRNVYKDDVRRLNNLQFEHVQGGKTIAYFTFKADTQTFSKIFKIEQ